MREEIREALTKHIQAMADAYHAGEDGFDFEPLVTDLEDLITKAQSEVLQAVREAGPKDDPCPRRDGTKGNRTEQAWDSGFNSANDEWLTAINTVAKERGLS